MRIFKTILILLALSLFIAACAKTETTKTNTPANTAAPNANQPEPAKTLDELASVRTNYKEKCARCHQPDGTGGNVDIEGTTIKAKDLTSEGVKKDPDSELIEAIENGFPEDGMPGFKEKLSEQEIKDLVKFIRTEFQK